MIYRYTKNRVVIAHMTIRDSYLATDGENVKHNVASYNREENDASVMYQAPRGLYYSLMIRGERRRTSTSNRVTPGTPLFGFVFPFLRNSPNEK